MPWERVFLAGEWEHSGALTYSYATQHRHTCIAARAGFGDLLIGAGALVTEANGIDLDEAGNLRAQMVDLISASRSYQANVEVFNSAKELALSTLQMGR